jgi:hypothetical protein
MTSSLTTPEMSDKQRQLYFRIIDNRKDIHPIALRLYFLAEYFPPHKLDSALAWLVRNKITGEEFIKWHAVACMGSDLQMHKALLNVVDNFDPEAIIAGKNFRV